MQPEALLTISVEEHAHASVVRVNGELDVCSAPDLRAALVDVTARKPRRIVLELSELRFIDSSGLHVLVRARTAAQEFGGVVEIAGPSAAVTRLLRITGLDTDFPIATDALGKDTAGS